MVSLPGGCGADLLYACGLRLSEAWDDTPRFRARSLLIIGGPKAPIVPVLAQARAGHRALCRALPFSLRTTNLFSRIARWTAKGEAYPAPVERMRARSACRTPPPAALRHSFAPIFGKARISASSLSSGHATLSSTQISTEVNRSLSRTIPPAHPRP